MTELASPQRSEAEPQPASDTSERVASAQPSDAPKHRILALDAHRGLALVILLLVNTAGIRGALPSQLDHPEWHGLTFADTFFPVFLFAMGAAMEFSARARRPGLVLRRAVLLFAIGVALNFIRRGDVALPGILQKIAVAYVVAWLVLRLPARWHMPVAVGSLAAIWAAFTWLQPAGVVAGSWERGTNLAGWIDTVVIGHPATEGFATALFAAVNVLGGALVIRGVRGLGPRESFDRLAMWALVCITIGLVMNPAVPINKRIWTPSFVIVTHGIACAYLAVSWWVTELRGHSDAKRSPLWRSAVRPFVALGRNPIFIYVLFTVTHVLLRPVREPVMDALGGAIGPLPASFAWSAMLLAIAWALAGWMDRRKLYVRV